MSKCGSMRLLSVRQGVMLDIEMDLGISTSALTICYWTKGISEIQIIMGNSTHIDVGEK